MTQDRRQPDDRPVDRRGFFREGFASLLGPLSNMVERKLDLVRQQFREPPPRPRLLRPPGALPEAEFLAACQSCGKCASVCPVGAIYLIHEQVGQGGIYPVISPSGQPCVLCESLACMSNCPSGALRPTRPAELRMGLAQLRPEACERVGGRDCTACIDACPLEEGPIHLAHRDLADDTLAPVVVEPGCVGCGCCEHACPAKPKAITVQPAR